MGSDSVESDGLLKAVRFLRAIKIHRTTSFGGEFKPSAPCRKILRHVKIPSRNDRDKKKVAAAWDVLCDTTP
jgi:hypothetical protein